MEVALLGIPFLFGAIFDQYEDNRSTFRVLVGFFIALGLLAEVLS